MLVSVLVPLFNSEEYIKDAIESVLNQSYENFELLVIDDGSTDKSAEIVSQFKDSRIKLHRRNHSGLIDGLNYGLAVAKGEVIARFDNDDICLEGRLKNQISFLKGHPDVGVVAGGAYLIDETGKIRKSISMPEHHDDISHCLESFFNPIIHPAVVIRKDILSSLGGYGKRFQAAEDYDLWLRLLRKGIKFHNLPYPIIKLRKHSKNMSMVQLKSSTRSCFFSLFEHFFWKKNRVEITALTWDLQEQLMKKAEGIILDTGLIETWCWRVKVRENLKTDPLGSFIDIGKSLFDINKWGIVFNRKRKIVSRMESMVERVGFEKNK